MTQNNKPRLIAVTGGIGSGKSTVAEIIKSRGYSVVSCDEITKSLYKKRSIKKSLKKAFPSAVSGRICLKADKKRIARLCFNDDGNYKKLCDILTMPTFKKAIKTAKKIRASLCFIEVPLLFEYGLQNEFDEVIVVTRNIGDRIKSVKTRSSLTEKEVRERIDRQFDYESADLSRYEVIKNDGDLSELKNAVVKILDKINFDGD